jgi:hypothetical protein
MIKVDRYGTILFRVILITGMFLLAACNQITAPGPQDEATASSIQTQQNPISSTEGNTSDMTPSLLTPADASLQNLIETIKTDLANRQAVSVDEITLIETMEMEWSDSSLDCPQPGMEYLQVTTPGFRIVLQVNNQSYEYHTNRDTYFVYCETGVPPILPKP